MAEYHMIIYSILLTTKMTKITEKTAFYNLSTKKCLTSITSEGFMMIIMTIQVLFNQTMTQ